jgi:threonine aldolase
MSEICKDFSSDNIAAAAPEMLRAVAAANQGTARSYGDDDLTRRLHDLACETFGCALAIYPVATGTAANALALTAMAPSHGGIYCHETAHVQKDECGAPEFFTGGAKLIGLPGAAGKIAVAPMRAAFAEAVGRGIHQVKPAAVSLSQATEWGTVYTPEEVATVGAFAHANGMFVHMDGARLGNAVAHLGVSPAEASWRAGVDVLSLGATKNGAIAAEAVVFFNLELAAEFAYRRKRAGQLLSKMRFFSAQLVAYLTDGFWLRHAARANAMATRLAAGLETIAGVRLTQAVQANELFPALPERVIEALIAEGFGFYRWAAPEGEGSVIRLVTAWNTSEADVDHLLAAIARHAAAA